MTLTQETGEQVTAKRGRKAPIFKQIIKIMNLKELNEIFSMQMCMLDEGNGDNLNGLFICDRDNIPDPDALVLFYDKKGYYKIGKGKDYFFVKEEHPNLNLWYIIPDDTKFEINNQMMWASEEYCEPDLWNIINSIKQHQTHYVQAK